MIGAVVETDDPRRRRPGRRDRFRPVLRRSGPTVDAEDGQPGGRGAGEAAAPALQENPVVTARPTALPQSGIPRNESETAPEGGPARRGAENEPCDSRVRQSQRLRGNSLRTEDRCRSRFRIRPLSVSRSYFSSPSAQDRRSAIARALFRLSSGFDDAEREEEDAFVTGVSVPDPSVTGGAPVGAGSGPAGGRHRRGCCAA